MTASRVTHLSGKRHQTFMIEVRLARNTVGVLLRHPAFFILFAVGATCPRWCHDSPSLALCYSCQAHEQQYLPLPHSTSYQIISAFPPPALSPPPAFHEDVAAPLLFQELSFCFPFSPSFPAFWFLLAFPAPFHDPPMAS